MRAGGIASWTDFAQDVARVDPIADFDIEFARMTIASFDAIAVVENYIVTITSAPASEFYPAAVQGIDWRARRGANI